MTELDSIRRMPFSIEAEQAILGTIILDPERFGEIAFLSAEDFYLEQHQLIYLALTDMFIDSKTIDSVTLINKLTQSGKYTEGDAGKYVKSLVDLSVHSSNIVEYAQIVQDKAMLRHLIEASRDITEHAFSESGDAKDIVDYAESQIYNLRDQKLTKNFIHVREAIKNNFTTLQQLEKNPEAMMGLRTNFEGLDKVLIGLGAGDLVIVGARPGMGKTSFCLNLACNIAKTSKKEVVIFSLEMTAEQLSSRLLSSEALVDSYKMRSGKLDKEDWQRIASAGSVLSQTEILIDDSSDITVSEMKAKLRRRKNLGLVVIDYLGLMHGESGDRSNDNRVLEIAKITRSLKKMAKEFGVPIILCSQLSRGSKEQKEGKKPSLTDLRDSGAIEQDADVVLFLHRAEYYNVGETSAEEIKDHELCDCIIAKNRHGSTGTIKLAWYGRHFRFVTADDRQDEPEG
ncbi:MAG: replicative DNA helicase [Clostridiales bacterium]|nr:replicative DNA helicase [Candidatus Coliplasma caballi]